MRTLLLATSNKGKVAEIQAVLSGADFTLLTLADIDIESDLEEPAMTLEGNALIKAITYGNQTGHLSLADDTGIFIDALDGAPGVHTARYARDHEERINKLLAALNDVPNGERGATFRTVVALYDPQTGRIRTCEGVCRGSITQERRGEGNFGIAPIFFVDEAGKTLGEMTMEEVNRVNHRGKALAKVREMLLQEFV